MERKGRSVKELKNESDKTGGPSSKSLDKDQDNSVSINTGSEPARKKGRKFPEVIAGSSETKRKSNNDNDDGGIKDSKQLLAIFPEEIWYLIAEKLPTPNDMENFCNSSQFFRNLLLDKRVLFLFPKVCNILLPKYHEAQSHYWTKNHKKPCSGHCRGRRHRHTPEPPKWYRTRPPLNFQEKTETSKIFVEVSDKISYLPPLSDRLMSRRIRWYSKILNLRLVCQDWCMAVENFYDNCWRHDDDFYHSYFGSTYYWLKNKCTLYNPNDDSDFLQHFRQTHEATQRNPFLLRKIKVCCDARTDDNEQFRNNNLILLEKYGRHIWYCDIDLGIYDPEEIGEEQALRTDLVDTYLHLRKILERLPNLKYLYIKQTGLDSSELESLSANLLNHLKREISLNSLPTFPNLEILRVEMLLAEIFYDLIQRNNHVQSVDIIDGLEIQERCDFYFTSMDNLKELKLKMTFYSETSFMRLENSFMRVPLDKFETGFNYGLMKLEWPQIFALLGKKWADSITDLEVELPRKEGGVGPDNMLIDCAKFRLNLPRLKRLKVKMPYLCSLDFMLPMKDSLEILEFYSDYHVMDRKKPEYLAIVKEQVIEFVGWTGRMLESNIWTIFPKLKRIQLGYEKFHVYEVLTRADWKKEMKLKKLNGVTKQCFVRLE